MGGYLLNFTVYTAAMIGVIFVAILAYKKFSYSGYSKSKLMNIEDCINLAPRKNLYIIKAGSERFLIASDAEQTSLISKLEDTSKFSEIKSQNIDDTVMVSEVKNRSVDDLPVIVDFPQKKEKTKTAEQVLKNIVKSIK